MDPEEAATQRVEENQDAISNALPDGMSM
jgi:hypothetical protein